jgi:hypothetical protein
MKIIAEVCIFLFIKNFNKIYNKKSHHLLKKNIKQQDSIYGIKQKNVVSTTKYLHLTLHQNCVSKNEYPFPRTPIFGQSPSHHHHDQN